MSYGMIVLRVDGMSCSHCENAVRRAVGELPGIIGVEVSLGEKTVTVEYETDQVSVDAMRLAIEEQGYEVRD